MVSKPGKKQSAFHSAELDPLLHERGELKYHNTGLAYAENIEITPQGGFRTRRGLRDVGALQASAARIVPFNSSNGSAYDLVFSTGSFEAWSATAKLQTEAVAAVTLPMLPQLTTAQSLDTLLLFHRDLQPRRIKHLGPANWTVDVAPFQHVPNWDYGSLSNGDPYINAVPAKWQLEFIGLADEGADDGITGIFILIVAGQETLSITYNANMSTLGTAIRNAILALPNVAAGITVTSPAANKINVEFTGAGNEGDGWAITGTVVNKPTSAIISTKIVVGVPPGEPLWSAARGYPQCGAFYTQRLLLGGFKGVPNAWGFSILGDYYNFDERLNTANGPAIVPLDAEGGEAIERIIGARNLLLFSSKGEYWLAERALARGTAPNHVNSSNHGVKRGVPVVHSEGAAVFLHAEGGVIGEFRYTDVEGNFVAQDISLLASHLVVDVTDMAQRRATQSTDGNQVAIVQSDGQARIATLLREQEVNGFCRLTSPQALFKAVAVNGRNEMGFIVERPAGRRLERMETDLLLDEAVSFAFGAPQQLVAGLGRFNGRTDIWAIADNNVFGPFAVTGGTLTLPIAASAVTIGSWAPPMARSLPLDRAIGPGGLVLQRRGRIHSAQLSVLDTTSIAVGVNGGPLHDIAVQRFGLLADVPELLQPYSGLLTVRGLTGYADQPYITISQVRPGRMTVRSWILEASL